MKRLIIVALAFLVYALQMNAQKIDDIYREVLSSQKSIVDFKKQLEYSIEEKIDWGGTVESDFKKIRSGNDSYNYSDGSDEVVDYDNIEGYKFEKPFHIYGGDTLHNSILQFYDQIKFEQRLAEPISQLDIKVEYKDYPTIYEEYRSYDYVPRERGQPIVLRKIYFADGSQREGRDTINISSYKLEFPHMLPIDSILASVSFNFPSQIEKINLSTKGSSYSESNTIYANLINIELRKCEIVMSKEMYGKLCRLQGITPLGRVVESKKNSSILRATPQTTAYMKAVKVVLKKLLADINNNKYKTVADAVRNLNKEMPPNAPQFEYEYVRTYFFDKNIKEVNIYSATATDNVTKDIVIKNAPDELSQGDYRVATIQGYNKRSFVKFGICNTSGKWVVEPQYRYLDHIYGLFYDLWQKSEVGSTYKLDVDTRQLIEYKYDVDKKLNANSLLISEKKAINFNEYGISPLKGVANLDGDIIIPAKYESVWCEDDKYILRSMNLGLGLADAQGKILFPTVFARMSAKGGFTYATLVDFPNPTLVFDQNMQQITLDNWDALSKFGDGSPVILVKDNNNRSKFFIDSKGKVVIPDNKKYTYEEGCYTNRILVSEKEGEEKLYGYLDQQGELTIPCIYSKALSFRGNYAYVVKQGVPMLIDVNDNTHKILPSRVSSSYEFYIDRKDLYYLNNKEKYDLEGNKVGEY